MVFALAAFGVLGERRFILNVDEDKYGGPGLNETSLRNGASGERTNVEDTWMSLVELRRAERRAAAGCTPGSTSPDSVEVKDKLGNKWAVGPRTCLSKGAYGEVKKTSLKQMGDQNNESPVLVALKIQDITSKFYDGLYVYRAEVLNSLKWRGQNIVKIKAYFETPRQGFMALELASQDLLGAKKAGRVVQPPRVKKEHITVLEILSDVVPALVSMHEKFWVHRDLKIQNILMFKGEDRLYARVGDLGLACKVEDEGLVKFSVPDQADVRNDNQLSGKEMAFNHEERDTYPELWPQCFFVGTCGGLWSYMPPEHLVYTQRMLPGRSLSAKCTQRFSMKSDVWMLGVVLAELVNIPPPTFGLGWAMTVANEQIKDEAIALGQPPKQITAHDLAGFGTPYTTYAKNPTALPSEELLLNRDKTYGGELGCLKELLQGMLRIEKSRLTMAEVDSRVKKWQQGVRCY